VKIFENRLIFDKGANNSTEILFSSLKLVIFLYRCIVNALRGQAVKYVFKTVSPSKVYAIFWNESCSGKHTAYTRQDTINRRSSRPH